VIAEALEAVWMATSALAAWIVAGVVAVTVGLYAVVVAGWGIWRVLVAAWTAAGLRWPQEPAGAPRGSSRVSADAGAPSVAADGRTALPSRPEPPAAGPSRPHSPRQSAPQTPGGPFPAPNPERPSEARLRRPSWARTDKDAA
jgi:hypothetical protein